MLYLLPPLQGEGWGGDGVKNGLFAKVSVFAEGHLTYIAFGMTPGIL